MRFDPAAWAQVHDRREPRHFAFWRGVELSAEVCAGRVRPGELWADVGCGGGHLVRALASQGARAAGIDHDLGMARYARRRGAGRFAVAAAASLALRDGSCAGLVAISLLGCLADPEAFLAEAARVLAPGGTLCLSAMNRHSLLLAASKPWSWRPGRRPERYAAYDPAALTEALRVAGFLPLRQILYGHFVGAGRFVLPSPGAARRLERDVPPGRRTAWARQILLVARRG
jgi:SAM-dependent methyltransferase